MRSSTLCTELWYNQHCLGGALALRPHPPQGQSAIRKPAPRQRRDPRKQRFSFISSISHHICHIRHKPPFPYGGREGPCRAHGILGLVVPEVHWDPPGWGSARSLEQFDPSAAPSPPARPRDAARHGTFQRGFRGGEEGFSSGPVCGGA